MTDGWLGDFTNTRNFASTRFLFQECSARNEHPRYALNESGDLVKCLEM